MKKLFKLILSSLSKLSHNKGLKKYLIDTSWRFLEQILRIISGLFVGIYLTRYLGPMQFGLYSYATAFATLFGTVARMGLDGIVVRELVTRPEQRDIYLGTAFWLKLIGALLALGLLAIAAQFTANDTTTNIYIFIVASGLVFQSFDVADFYFQSKVLSKYTSICRLIQLILSSTLKILLILSQAELLWFVIVSLIDQASIALFITLAYWRQRIGSFFKIFDLSTAKTLLKNAWPFILSGIAVSLYMRADQIMIKEMLGEKAVGLYSAAIRLSEAWHLVPVVITTSLFPAILNAKKQGLEIYRKRLQRLYGAMIYSAFGAAIFVALLAEMITDTLYGPEYQDASRVLAIHIWSGIFMAIGVVNGSWFLAENLQKFATLNVLIGATANAALNYLLIPLYGIQGAAIATVAAYFVSAYLALLLHKETRRQFYEITRIAFLQPWRTTRDNH